MEKHLELAHALDDELRWRRNKGRIAGACASDPVLAPAKLTGFLVASPPARKQDFVDLANEAEGQRKAFPYPFQSMIEGRDIIGNVLDVFDGNAGNFMVFEKQEIGERMIVYPRSA